MAPLLPGDPSGIAGAGGQAQADQIARLGENLEDVKEKAAGPAFARLGVDDQQ